MSSSHVSAAVRRVVVERAGGCCEYCRIAQEDQFFTFEIDHIIAEKHGGPTQSDNLCLSCVDCNAFKGSDLASIDWDDDENLVRLFHLRKDVWTDHFRIEMSMGRIEPLTAVGRVTVALLHMNDPERMTDRRLLIQARRYPC